MPFWDSSLKLSQTGIFRYGEYIPEFVCHWVTQCMSSAPPALPEDDRIYYVALAHEATVRTLCKQYLRSNPDLDFAVDDFNASVAKFQLAPWKRHYEQPHAFDCNGELYQWIWVCTLPQHPLCREYLDAYRIRRFEVPPESIMPVRVWAVQEFERVHGHGSAARAVDFLQKSAERLSLWVVVSASMPGIESAPARRF